jgi:hypothetical protein
MSFNNVSRSCEVHGLDLQYLKHFWDKINRFFEITND